MSPAPGTDPFGPAASDLVWLETRMLESLPRSGPELASFRRLVGAGGKRLRPALVMLSARLGTFDRERAGRAAIAVELVHASTLVHDDVIDNAPTRRGRPTVAADHGEAAAIVVGDHFFAQAYAMAAGAGAEVVSLLAGAVMDICRGELEQQRTRYVYRLPARSYDARIRGKTASLLASACAIGAAVSGSGPAAQAALVAYGTHLGIAFQIVDDVLDYVGSEADVGKPVGHDLLEGHSTLPLMLAYSDPDLAPRLDALLLAGHSAGPEVVSEVVRLVRGSGAVAQARRRALLAARRAGSHLRTLPAGPARSALEGLAGYVVDRSV